MLEERKDGKLINVNEFKFCENSMPGGLNSSEVMKEVNAKIMKIIQIIGRRITSVGRKTVLSMMLKFCLHGSSMPNIF